MNYRQVLKILCLILRSIAGLMLLPILVGVLNHERETWSFVVVAVLCAAISLITYLFPPKARSIYAREGFLIVSLSWLFLGVLGALPFLFSGAIPRFVDAFFEIVSGFTTTGASILNDIEALPQCMLFWRCFSIWIGGMGVLVFILAIVPLSGGRDMHILRAEAPGPSVGKLVPKMKQTAMILYGIYIALTVIETILLLFGGMSFFDAVTHAFSNAGTGGFSTKNAGIAAFNSTYIEIVIIVFMFLCSVNFNLFYFLLIKRVKDVAKNEEFRWYLLLVGVSVIAIACNIASLYNSFGESLRHSAFQVLTITSTTGFASANFIEWPEFSRMVLLLLMFCGGCAGSTAGGLKLSRVIIFGKSIMREMRRLSHPRSVAVVKIDNQPLDEEVVTGTTMYFLTYIVVIVVGLLLLSFNGLDFETTFSAVITTFNNVGPGLGELIGPMGNFASLSDFSKIVLSFLMLLGRLEIFPMLLLLSPSIWYKRRAFGRNHKKRLGKR
ncbi:MAG: TrkH family potassium uptake protein [Clostridia bacterium]|nr:TrkH family potassium uptake protein [Clostridia bacterium]